MGTIHMGEHKAKITLTKLDKMWIAVGRLGDQKFLVESPSITGLFHEVSDVMVKLLKGARK